jgi:predicted dehydrogenase
MRRRRATTGPTVALHGAGVISRAHAGAAAFAGARMVAVASRTPERAAERASEVGASPVPYRALTDGSVAADVVVVATPPACHADDVVALLATGASVMVEKPLCTTLADADRMVAAADTAAGRLLYAENLAYAPVVQQLLVRVPRLGPLGHLEVRAMQGPPTWGDYTSDVWGGGALFDLGAHPLAVALLCANASGAGAPTWVRAELTGGAGHHTDEHAVVQLGFVSGLVARVVASWQAGPRPQWDVQLASDTGVLRAELLPEPQLEHDGEEVALPPARAEVPEIERLGYLGQLRAMLDARARGVEPVMSARFGRLVLEVTCAAYRSAGRAGEPEPVPFSGARDRTPLELWRGESAPP